MSRFRRDAGWSGALAICVLAVTSVAGQRGGPPQPPPAPRAAAPFDLTGQWIAVVNEDWRHRMTVPPKGDYTGVPLNPNGRRTAALAANSRSNCFCRSVSFFGISIRICTSSSPVR